MLILYLRNLDNQFALLLTLSINKYRNKLIK